MRAGRRFLHNVEPNQTDFLQFACLSRRIEHHRINHVVSALGSRQFVFFDDSPGGFYRDGVIWESKPGAAGTRQARFPIKLLIADKVEFHLIQPHFKTYVGMILSDQRPSKPAVTGLIEVPETRKRTQDLHAPGAFKWQGTARGETIEGRPFRRLHSFLLQ